jgi:hypothetical protein
MDEEAAAGAAGHHGSLATEKPQHGAAEYAQDGSVDLRGNPVLRSKRGGWTACSFIVGTCFLPPCPCGVQLLHRRYGP